MTLLTQTDRRLVWDGFKHTQTVRQLLLSEQFVHSASPTSPPKPTQVDPTTHPVSFGRRNPPKPPPEPLRSTQNLHSGTGRPSPKSLRQNHKKLCWTQSHPFWASYRSVFRTVFLGTSGRNSGCPGWFWRSSQTWYRVRRALVRLSQFDSWTGTSLSPWGPSFRTPVDGLGGRRSSLRSSRG